MAWNPGLYERFADSRQRPGIDLIAAIPDLAARRIVDLGCGTGRLTERLRARWPGAEVTGLDGSAAMLERARENFPDIAWIEGDISAWRPAGDVDIILSNAALHWLPDHETLLPRLFGHLAPGGALAVQMPRNWDAPSHGLIYRTAEELGLAERIGPPWIPVAPPEVYYDLLAPLAASLDIWETVYLQRLEGENPIVDWLRGTALQPVLDKLDADEAGAFLSAYGAHARAAYPRRPDGVTLFPFRRLFIVATAGG